MEEKRIVKPWQAGLMLLVGIAVIIVGLLVMKLNNRIVLALDGVIVCLMAWCFGIPYAELQQGIKETVSTMIVAILILLAVGVLVGTWMASGTVPVMIYYGMKVLTPGLFLPVVCILCTLMSTMAGTSWGTLATVGVACMGVAQGLGVPLPAAAGAVCTGAFFGDKVSPLPDRHHRHGVRGAADGRHSPRAHFHGACVSHFARFLLCLRPALFRRQRRRGSV